MFGIVLPLDLILSFLLYLTGKPEKNDQLCCNNLALIEILERNGTNIEPILLAQKGNTLIYSFVWLLISILVLFAYLIMLVSARAMSLHVRLKLKVDTDRFTEINQQLTLNIIAYLLTIGLGAKHDLAKILSELITTFTNINTNLDYLHFYSCKLVQSIFIYLDFTIFNANSFANSLDSYI
uniref:Uncharacterized protein n=1 Tax=Meloidogyne incognita TaxID=6306 RepID=A0A914L0S2_MELIC